MRFPESKLVLQCTVCAITAERNISLRDLWSGDRSVFMNERLGAAASAVQTGETAKKQAHGHTALSIHIW